MQAVLMEKCTAANLAENIYALPQLSVFRVHCFNFLTLQLDNIGTAIYIIL